MVNCVGCLKNGISEAAASEIFDDMLSFASYAFNKSHAAAYATVAYQTAYLKLHYYKEYMAALITSVLDSSSKVTEYTSDCEAVTHYIYGRETRRGKHIAGYRPHHFSNLSEAMVPLDAMNG